MKKENFEEQLRRTFETHESSTSNATWSAIEKQLGSSIKGSKFGLSSGSIITIVAILGLSAIATWKLSSSKNASIDFLSTENVPSQNESLDAENSTLTLLSAAESEISSSENTNGLASNDISQLHIEKKNELISENTFTRSNQLNNSPVTHSTNSSGQNISFEIVHSNNQSSGGAPSSTKEHSSILSNVRQTCAGTEVNFKPQNSPSDGSYLWNFGDGAFSNEPSPKHRFLKPGTYEVSLSVTDNKNAQINTVNMSETITILPNPDADFDWKFINSAKEAPMVEINNLTQHATSAKWSFADGTESEELNPTKTFTTKGRHAVSVTAVNEYGCKDNRVKYININSDYNLNAPGSIQLGEIFLPDGLKNIKAPFELSVYDGARKIFETKNDKTGWSGKDQNSQLVEVNKQYPWIAIIHDPKTGEDRYYSGAVLVKP